MVWLASTAIKNYFVPKVRDVAMLSCLDCSGLNGLNPDATWNDVDITDLKAYIVQITLHMHSCSPHAVESKRDTIMLAHFNIGRSGKVSCLRFLALQYGLLH